MFNTSKAIKVLSDEEELLNGSIIYIAQLVGVNYNKNTGGNYMSITALDFLSEMQENINKEEISKVELLDFIALQICKECKSYFAFKGGYTLSKMLEEPRMTQDIDISIQAKEDYEEFKLVLTSIGNNLIERGLITTYEIKPDITETSSGGIKCRDESGEILVGVDIGLHQLTVGVGRLDFTFDEVNAFVPERMIADKISAILSRKRFRRAKDIYDLYCLTTQYRLNYTLLKELVDMRLEGNEGLWDNIPFNEIVLVQYEHAYDKLVLKSFFNGEALIKPPFSKVCSLFYKLVEPLKKGELRTEWNNTTGVWMGKR